MPAVLRISRILAIALAIVLLVDQSISFAIEQLHRTSSETLVLVCGQSDLPTRDNGKTRDAGSHCHGCHFYNLFLGQIARAPGAFPIIVGAEAPRSRRATRVLTTSLEPPYRPPRISPLA